jgi:hypothetical protein
MNKPNNTRAIALATLTAICVMAGVARAEDGGSEDHMIPAAFIPGDDGNGNGGDVLSCKELREAAWFIQELQRSDGDVNPAAAPVECRSDVYAEFTGDAE